VIEGIRSNIPLQHRILSEEDFVRGRIHTGFMDRFAAPAKKPVE
jgi:biotin carboxylase